jgi:esterase/lipase
VSGRRITTFALGFAAGFGSYRLLRTPSLGPTSQPEPATDYAGALEKLQALEALDTARVNPVCRTRLLTHGHMTERAIVMLHGFTNCPQQFVDLADEFFDAGFNVLIPRLPRHGLERLAEDLKDVTVEELIMTANRAIDIAHGLGERVILFGFSMGGLLAGWFAQNREDIDRVILVSPGLGMAGVAPALMSVYANGLRWLPNFFRWWDADVRESREGPQHAYPRIPSHGIAALLRLSLALQRQVHMTRPAVDDILVVTNPCDDTVRNSVTEEVVFYWRLHGADVATYCFPQEWALIHDIIDPQQTQRQTERVYPVLRDLIC